MLRALVFTLALVCAASASQAQTHTPYDFATGLNGPRFMTQLTDGTVLVAEYLGGRVSAYPPGGGSANRTDFATGLGGPASVTQLADGTVLVVEWNSSRVSAFPASGGNANRTDFATGLTEPYGVTQLADGTVLVAEHGANRVSAFAASGGNATRTDFATGLGNPAGVTQLVDGTVLISERSNNRVSAYPASGGNANRTDFATGLNLPYGVTQLADGTVLVAEYGGGRVSAFPAAGGASNRSDFATGLSQPISAVQLDDGTVLVVEVGNNRVLAYGLTRRPFTSGMTITQGVTQLSDGRVLVADFGFGGIREFATDGTETRFATVSGNPTDIIELPNGVILVSLLGTDVIAAFDASGTRLTPDYATGLSNPTGFGTLADGRVVVAEQSGNRVTVVADASGGRVTPSLYISNVAGPFDLARLDDGRMLVTERNANRVSVISDASGTALVAPSPLVSTLNNPTGITQLGDGRVLVSEFNDAELTAFESDGSSRTQFAGALTRATFVTQLADGRVLVGQEFISQPGTGQVTEFGGLPAPPASFQLTGAEGWRTLALPKAGITLGGRGPGYLAPIHTAGYVGADSDQRNRRGTANVFLYDEPTGTLVTPRRENSVASGEGFWVYVREDDVPYGQSGVQGGFPKTLDASGGTSVTGAHIFGLSYSSGSPFPGVNLVGNPYDEAIDWDDPTWTKTDIGTTVYVWDPALNPPDGDYRLWDGSTGDLADGVIPAGQGFHVEALSASAALTVTEAAKTGEPGILNGLVASGETVASSKATGGARGLAFRLSGTVGGHTRESRGWISLAPEAALGLDARDGRRLAGASGANALRLYTLVPEGHAGAGDALAIASLPEELSSSVEIPLQAEALASGAPSGARATLAWDAATLPAGWTAVLVDRASGERHALGAAGEIDLRLAPEDALTHSAADLAPEAKTGDLPPVPQARALRVAADKASGARFTLVLSPGDAATLEAVVGLGAPSPNPSRGVVRVPYTLASSGEARLSVVDAVGREVAVLASGAHAAGLHEATLDASAFAPGVYVVRLGTPEASVVRRITVVR